MAIINNYLKKKNETRARLTLDPTDAKKVIAEELARDDDENGITLVRAHSGTSNETGGFLVPDEFENVMIDLRIEYGVFRRNANVVPMASDTKSS